MTGSKSGATSGAPAYVIHQIVWDEEKDRLKEQVVGEKEILDRGAKPEDYVSIQLENNTREDMKFLEGKGRN